MKFLKWLLGGVLVLVAVLLLGGLLVSPQFELSRSVTINAPPERIYPLIADPKRWSEWTEWNRRDPAMQMSYTGPASGAGAGWAWNSKTEGEGRMHFTSAETGKRLGYELFFPEFESSSQGELSLVAEGPATRVTWSMRGHMGGNPMHRWVGLMMDRMVGPDFEAGLANLKRLAEKP